MSDYHQLIGVMVLGLEEVKRAIDGEEEFVDQSVDERFSVVSNRIGSVLTVAMILQEGVRTDVHMHGVDVCAYCAEGDVAIKELARQHKTEGDPAGIRAYHECCREFCFERAEYVVRNGIGQTWLVCKKHYDLWVIKTEGIDE